MDSPIEKLIEDIERKHAQRDALWHELKRSLALRAMVPSVFDHGTCTGKVVGSIHNLRKMRYIITRGDGIEFPFPILEVSDLVLGDLKTEILQDCNTARVRLPVEWREKACS